MARHKRVDISPRLLPVDLKAQLVPGTFAHALHHLIDELNLTAFDARNRNDANGAPAQDPAMLLRAVLLGYPQGLVSSRAIERACRDNVLCVAITGAAKPRFTTIATFVSHSRNAIAAVFAQGLAIIGKEGLIGREMFAIDGVKLPDPLHDKSAKPRKSKVFVASEIIVIDAFGGQATARLDDPLGSAKAHEYGAAQAATGSRHEYGMSAQRRSPPTEKVRKNFDPTCKCTTTCTFG